MGFSLLDQNGRYLPVKVKDGEVSIAENHKVVRERKVILDRVRVKERPDQSQEVFKAAGKFTVPVHVIALIRVIDGDEEEKAMWPVNLMAGTQGMWWSSVEAWEEDEPMFMKLLNDELERLKYVTEQQFGVGV